MEVEKSKGSEETQLSGSNTSTEEKGDLYLASISTQSDHESWFIKFGAYFHMTPHIEWLCGYEKFYNDDIPLGDESPTKIVKRGKGRPILKYGMSGTLPSVFPIPSLPQNMIYVSKMGNASV